MTESLDELRARRDASAAKLRKTLAEIPGATEAFRSVLEDPKVKVGIQNGVGIILGMPARAKEVGWLVAVAEINDREIRMAAAEALQEAIRRGRGERMTTQPSKELTP